MRRKPYRSLFISLCSLLLFAGCAVGPNYKRPEVSRPGQSIAPIPPCLRLAPTAPAVTFGDVKWFDLFQDETLQELIRTALKDNYDVRIAAQRVLAAQAYVTVEKSALYPSVNAEASADRQQGSQSGSQYRVRRRKGLLGAGHLGQNSPLDRSRPGRVPGPGGSSAGRNPEPGDRGGEQLFSTARTGPGADGGEAVTGFPPGLAPSWCRPA